MSVDELAEEFGVIREQVDAVLQFAAHSAEAPHPPRFHRCLILFDNGTPRTLARYLIGPATDGSAKGDACATSRVPGIPLPLVMRVARSKFPCPSHEREYSTVIINTGYEREVLFKASVKKCSRVQPSGPIRSGHPPRDLTTKNWS